MPASIELFIIVAAVLIVILVVLLAATRRSLSGPRSGQTDSALATGKYPFGYWMTIGVCAGLALGLLLGIVVRTLTGGLSIGLGIGLILGKWLDSRFDKGSRQFTEEEQQYRLRRATWGLIAMIVMVILTLVSAVLPLLD